jgi:hypothetical protein
VGAIFVTEQSPETVAAELRAAWAG